MIRSTCAGGLLEGTKAEDVGDQWPEVRNVGDDHGGCRFASVPVQVDEGAVRSSEVFDAVEKCAEDL